ncbi:MAG: GAP family protein [Mycobacterium sp.]
MTGLILVLLGLACLDSLNVLNIGAVSAVIYDSRLNRRSPIPGGTSYILGVFTALLVFGVATVLGLHLLTDLFDFDLTPTIRYRGELLLGVTLIALAFFPVVAQTSTPGWAMGAMGTMRRRPWLLGFVGVAVGLGQAPTAVPYLTGLAMIAALDPRPALWPLLILGYCTLVVLPCASVLALSTSRSKRAQRAHRWVVRSVTRYGPIGVRVLFLVAGVVLISDALIHHAALW